MRAQGPPAVPAPRDESVRKRLACIAAPLREVPQCNAPARRGPNPREPARPRGSYAVFLCANRPIEAQRPSSAALLLPSAAALPYCERREGGCPMGEEV